METTEFVKQLRLAVALNERAELDRLVNKHWFADRVCNREDVPIPATVHLSDGIFYSVNGIRRKA